MSSFPVPISGMVPKHDAFTQAFIRRNVSCGLWQRDYNAYDAFDLLTAVGGVALGRDPHFSLAGTGTVPAPALLVGGGQTIASRTAAAADGDEARLFPYAGSTFNDPFLPNTVPAGQFTLVEWHHKTPAAVGTPATTTTAGMEIYSGLKLTDTGVIATDADQVLFVYDTDDIANFGPAGVGTSVASQNWKFVFSVGGNDIAIDTGVPVTVSTIYHFVLIFDSVRTCSAYINGALVARSTALTATAALKCAAGVASRVDAGAAKSLGVRGVRISRNLF